MNAYRTLDLDFVRFVVIVEMRFRQPALGVYSWFLIQFIIILFQKVTVVKFRSYDGLICHILCWIVGHCTCAFSNLQAY